MARSNFVVRGGADFSGIQREIQRTQAQMRGFQASAAKSMSNIGKAFKIGLGYISLRAIAGFGKSCTDIASDLTEVQNVVDVVFGNMAKDINEFSKISINQFGLSELSAKRYSSTMGAMLKSSGIAGKGVRDMSLELTKLSADMASFYNIDNDVAFQKIMSGMSGETMPLKQLGINMNIANLEAFAMSKGIQKSYREMSQAEQTLLRYNYLLSVTGDAQGDFSRNVNTWANQTKILSQQWEILKGTIGAGFINMLTSVVAGLNALIKKIQIAAEYFKAFTVLIFGDSNNNGGPSGVVSDMADNLGDVEDGLGGVGNAGKKAAKDLKRSVAGFDELNLLMEKTTDSTEDIGDALSGIGGVDLGSAETGEMDIDTSKFESKMQGLKDTLKDFYDNWGMKDIFQGIREGLDLVDFSAIKTNLKTAFSGLGEIARHGFSEMQPIAQSVGQAIGTGLKYGIALVGNLFEPISLGFANFATNMKEPIKNWMTETSQTIAQGFNNITGIFEIIGQTWLESIEKYKPIIAQATEDTLTNIANSYMLAGTIMADYFEIVTGKILEFAEENRESLQKFTDGILEIFTGMWQLVNHIWADGIELLKNAWEEWGKETVGRLMDVVKDIGVWVLYLFNDLIKPIWDKGLEMLKEIWDESLKDMVAEIIEFVGNVAERILFLWENVLQPLVDLILTVLVPVFREEFKAMIEVVGTAVKAIADIITNLLKILNGVTDFLLGVFTGDWTRAWEGMSKIFEGIMGGLGTIFKIPINLIITNLNSFLRGLNNIKIPDFVPGIGGKGFNIPQIPHLARGGVIDSPTLAMVGEAGKEVVMPLENNTGWIDDLATRIGSSIGGSFVGGNSNDGSEGPTTIILQVGETELARTVVNSLRQLENQTGRAILSY